MSDRDRADGSFVHPSLAVSMREAIPKTTLIITTGVIVGYPMGKNGADQLVEIGCNRCSMRSRNVNLLRRF